MCQGKVYSTGTCMYIFWKLFSASSSLCKATAATSNQADNSIQPTCQVGSRNNAAALSKEARNIVKITADNYSNT